MLTKQRKRGEIITDDQFVNMMKMVQADFVDVDLLFDCIESNFMIKSNYIRILILLREVWNNNNLKNVSLLEFIADHKKLKRLIKKGLYLDNVYCTLVELKDHRSFNKQKEYFLKYIENVDPYIKETLLYNLKDLNPYVKHEQQ
jgi:hypothetical protein